MDQRHFHLILQKYLRGEASREEKEIIDRWYHNMGKDKESFLHEARELSSESRYWSRIKKVIGLSGGQPRTGSIRWYSLGLAASALLIVVSYFNIQKGHSEPGPADGEERSSLVVYKRIVNRGQQADEVTLPDGSRVTLEPRSKIQYAPAFDGPERTVYLDGKAFFDVVKDENRPFKVNTQKLITRVLGTSFAVTAFRDQNEVTVSVKTGKVSVLTRTQGADSLIRKEVVLTPNQEFIYNKEKDRGERSIVEEPQAIVPPEVVKRMRFEETSPKVIFEAIEKVYGVDIVFDEEKFSSCRITTSISDGNIFNRIHIMCEVMNATYRVEDAKIIIEGDGCHSPI